MTGKPPPFAVIFDFDGVIFETEQLHCAALGQILSAEGVELMWGEYAKKYVGLSDREIIHRLTEVHPVLAGKDTDALLDEKSRVYSALSESGIAPIPGVARFIRRLHADGIPIAICSGSRRAEIERMLAHSNLAAYFKCIVATEDVSASKPSPEGYLLALNRIRAGGVELAADRCVVIEDASAGITAARAAGMRALALAKDYGDIASANPDAIIQSFDDVTDEFVMGLIGSGA